MVKVLAISGSPSHPSRSHSVLEYSDRILKSAGIDSEIISVRDFPAEALLFAQFDHPQIQQIAAQVATANGIIIATPVYKAAYTGVLKALLDLLPQQALVGKSILPIATGGTIAHLLAIDYAVKPVLSALGARDILSGVYIVDSQIQRQENGEILLDAEIEERLQNTVDSLIQTLRPTESLATNRS